MPEQANNVPSILISNIRKYLGVVFETYSNFDNFIKNAQSN